MRFATDIHDRHPAVGCERDETYSGINLHYYYGTVQYYKYFTGRL